MQSINNFISLLQGKAPYKIGDKWLCMCSKCNEPKEFKYELTTYTGKILLCTECFKLISQSATSIFDRYKQRSIWIENELKTKINCYKCGGDNNPEFFLGMTFYQEKNTPILEKSACSPECYKGCKKEDNKEIKDAGIKSELKTSCSVCRKFVDNIKKCSRCKTNVYCGKECQKKDWERHKASCVRRE